MRPNRRPRAVAGTAGRTLTLLRPDGLARPVAFLDADPVRDLLGRITRGWAMPPEDVFQAEDAAILVARQGSRYTLVSDWLARPATGLGAVEAVCSLGVDLSLAWLDAAPDTMALHCGAVEIGGRLVLMAGGNRAGKSTLVVRLAAEARVFGDDVVPLGPDGAGIGLGIAPRLRLPVPKAADPAFRAFAAAHCVAEDGRYCYVAPPDLARHGSQAVIGAVLLLERKRSGPAFFAAAGRAEVLRALLLRNLTEDRDSGALFAGLGRVLDRATALTLVYSDIEDAARLILATFRDGATVDLAPKPAAAPARRRAAPAPRRLAARPYRCRAGLEAREIDREIFLADAAERAILHLNPVGAAIWRLLGEGTSERGAAEIVQAAFPLVAPARIDADVAAVFAAMRAAGVIEPVPAA